MNNSKVISIQTLESLISYFSLTITHIDLTVFRMLNLDQTCAVIMYAEGN